MKPTVLELCAGAGGQALGFEQAGFDHAAVVEIDKRACETLRLNRPDWNVVEGDITDFDPAPYQGVDVVAAGLPCPPFSKAGKQLGEEDERNLFPAALEILGALRPQAIVIENVRGVLDPVFDSFRRYVSAKIESIDSLGYWTDWHRLNASNFGVPQLRPRVVFIAIRKGLEHGYMPPLGPLDLPKTVGETLYDLMAANGWKGARAWKEHACDIAPTLVGGSKKHGGPDLGPTRARQAWSSLGVNGGSIAEDAPSPDFVGMPHLTVRMAARIQGFPDDWKFSGRKTAAYRQIGNAFPPPVARAVAERVIERILAGRELSKTFG